MRVVNQTRVVNILNAHRSPPVVSDKPLGMLSVKRIDRFAIGLRGLAAQETPGTPQALAPRSIRFPLSGEHGQNRECLGHEGAG